MATSEAPAAPACKMCLRVMVIGRTLSGNWLVYPTACRKRGCNRPAASYHRVAGTAVAGAADGVTE